MITSLALVLLQTAVAGHEPQLYHAWLDTQGGALDFGLELQPETEGTWRAFLINGEERIEVPRVTFDGRELLLDMPHYDSRIRARVVESLPPVSDGPKGMIPFPASGYLQGEWEKTRGADVAHVPFAASRVLPNTWACGSVSSTSITGRWAVDFESDDSPAVLVLEGAPPNRMRGTFLTTTGDYRYMAGWFAPFDQELDNLFVRAERTELELSCFDGAHAFLFKASRKEDGTLAGDFWSGNWHHETWTAKRDDSAALPDAFAQTKWNGTTKLADLRFPDLDGKPHALSEFAGKATLLVVFGSWCPNCNDEAKVLADFDAKYRERGLRILGLAFELTGEFARDAGQVRIFAERHALSIPFFLCGTADKDEATKALGLVDHVRAFPTTIFVGADGLPRAIHSGFAGPATGDEHQKLRREFEARIEALLGPNSPK